MNSLLGTIFLFVAIVVLAAFIKGKRTPGQYPYQLSKYLLTKAERSFYGVLVQVVGEEAIIFSKVRVSDVLTPRKNLSRSDWQRAFNAVSAKHFDFLLCDLGDCLVKLAIELDDSSHGSAKSRKRDKFLNAACEAAGLPLLRVPAAKSYAITELRSAINSLLSPPLPESNAATLTPQKEIKIDEVESGEAGLDDFYVIRNSEDDESAPSCPKCGGLMVHRTAKSGSFAGKDFWGCKDFPKCRGVVHFNS